MWEMTFKKPRLIEGSSSSLCGQNLEGLIVVGSNPGSSKKGKTWRTTKIPGIHWDVKVAWASVRGSDFWLPQTPVAIVHLSWRVVFSDWNNAKHWFGHFHYYTTEAAFCWQSSIMICGRIEMRHVSTHPSATYQWSRES